MHAIEPDMVLGKEAIDTDGSTLGEILDVGLYSHSRVKYLIVGDLAHRDLMRRVGVEAIANVGEAIVHLRVD